jgi:hypothetical protein
VVRIPYGARCVDMARGTKPETNTFPTLRILDDNPWCYCANHLKLCALWKVGRVVNCSGFENRRGINALEGSNPSPSANDSW